MTPSTPYSELTAVARETAVAAGSLILDMLQTPRKISVKGFRDLVTDADVAAQKLITDRIREAFPSNGFVTEEEDSQLPETGDILWVIDPIDGTTNYSRRQPNFCVSIAALDPRHGLTYDAVQVGVIYDPARGELFTAVRDQGSTLNDTPIRVSPTENLADSMVAFDWSRAPVTRRSTRDLIEPLSEQAGWLRAIGTAALAMTWVAAGRFDAYLNYHLRTWDLAAAYLLVHEAGGQISAPDGPPAAWSDDGVGAVVSNGRLHPTLIQFIQQQA